MPDHIRVSVGTSADVDRFLAAVATVLKSKVTA
jgi:histidinol-phosphate/aromatic aminotransferase/cobyric acid decarboxylase-like protein